jgi:hypothetical protein
MNCYENAITLKRGETYNGATCTYTNNLNVAINITNYKIKIHFKKNTNSDVIDFFFSTDDGSIVFINASVGTFRLQPRRMNYDEGLYLGDFYIETTGQVVDISTNNLAFNILNAITT